MSTTPRVRFAPSPTGYLHLGSARAALFNWLAARHMGGKFLLRIEDTDKDRSRPELIDVIYEGLEWLGLDWDEEPLAQSTRDEAHQEAIEALIRDGAAYESEGAVRFRVPDDGGATAWDDLIRGEISVEHANIEDFVIRRSDGSPTFFLANASDDAHMGITHVIRGEDLINVTPKYLLLRRAMGIEGADPVFAHMPLIVNEQRKKLSKRRDDVSLMDYRDRGFLASAMVNYLALLGWGPPDGQEVRLDPLSMTDGFPPMFDIAEVSSSPAFFDVKKLLFVNAEHLRALSVDELDAASQPYLEASPVGPRLLGRPCEPRAIPVAAARGADPGRDAVGGARLRRLPLRRRARDRREGLEQGDGARRRRLARCRDRRCGRVAVDRRGAPRTVHGAGRGVGREPSEVPGAGPCGADRSVGGAAAVRVDGGAGARPGAVTPAERTWTAGAGGLSGPVTGRSGG